MWDILDKIGVVAGLLAFVGTAYSAYMWVRQFKREKQLQQPVPIRLVSAEDQRLLYELPFHPSRRLVTRAEVLGLLGMIPSKEAGKRFEWAWLHNPAFMADLEDVYNSRRATLEIRLSPEEFGQLRV